VKDDGLSYGQRSQEGFLEPQVKTPEPPIFPEDVDWKSINPELMYKILSFPSDVETGNRAIEFASNISIPPDYEVWFEERKFYYCKFGLVAYRLAEKLSSKYKIKKKVYNDWDPVADLENELMTVTKKKRKKN
jgi:hypothetical protein